MARPSFSSPMALLFSLLCLISAAFSLPQPLNSTLLTAGSSTRLSSHDIISASSTLFSPTSLSTIPLTVSTSSSSFSASTSQVSNVTSSTPLVTTSATTSTAAHSTSSVDPVVLEDMQTVLQRRLSFITVSSTNVTNISAWLSSLDANGKWPDSEVDYSTGCDAQRANWPAGNHWLRILTMSAAWHGGLEGATQWVSNTRLSGAISSAMSWWFDRDFTTPGCLDEGGTSSCPCGTAGLWNTNWFSNVILVPRLVGESCLLYNASLTSQQFKSCMTMTARAYDTFYEGGKSYLSGANILDIAKIGIDVSLLTTNTSLITEAYGRIHAEVVIEPGIMVDGIKPDGSFGQHGGLLYNGNYGKDYSNDVLELEIDAGGTQFGASADSQAAFTTLIDGDQWMIYRNVLTNVLHWDVSALPRFISFPVIDAQATGSLNLNLSEIQELGELWNSSTIVDVYNSLSKPTKTANAGNLEGNRNFYDNDYMVQRGDGYVSTLKMYSTRTKNTECTNSQNPLGFHLADGTLYNYVQGNEYEDIAAAWDWNLIPGTTVDYGATPLNCNNAEWTGLEAFVGGVSDGQIGAAAMKYTNPYTKSLRWQKAWFFLPDNVQHVLISNITSTSNASVYSVLDQRRHTGDIYVNGRRTTPKDNSSAPASSLWHGNMGYVFDTPFTSVSVFVGERTGAWSAIGTSTQPPTTVDLFAAWIEHKNLQSPMSYSVFPATDFKTFQRKSAQRTVRTLQNNGHVSAIYDVDYDTVYATFWGAAGGSLHFVPSLLEAPVTITASGNSAVIFNLKNRQLSVSDPSQTLSNLEVTIVSGLLGHSEKATFTLPTGGTAGSTVSKTLSG